MTADGDVDAALSRNSQATSIPHPVESETAPAVKSPVSRAAREVIETLLLAALIFFLVRLVVLNFRVDGESMLPNLNGGKYYPFDPPERGDVVVFNPPNGSDKPYIKRIIGLPGEEITFSDGHVDINGQPLEEDYIQDRTRCGRADTCDVVVPAGNVFVLGDHRSNSSDSRVFGPVPIENIVGKAWLSYWPPRDVGFVPHERYQDIAATAATP